MKRFSYILAGFTVLWALLTAAIPWCSPVVAGYLAPLGLLVIPLTIFSTLTTIIAVPCRSKAISLLFGTACLISLFLCGKSWAISFGTDESTSHSLRLVSWNAEGFQLNKDTLQASAVFIRNLHPDVICLQERPHDNLLHRDSISEAFGYPYRVFNSREDEVLNLAVYSRFPLSNMKEYYFPNSYNKVLQIDLQYEGRTIRLFNIHLQTTGMTPAFQGNNLLHTYQLNAKERNRQAQLLAEAISSSPYPVILCGDLNDTPISYAYRKLTAQLDDCFLEAGNSWGGTYQPANNLFRIDYIFCSPVLKTLVYRLYSNCWSDHRIQYTIATPL
ncbi:endonuclease/exonuclease/phosphatase family protein [Phocaeicola coprocola]|jgi:endonuclease/exonuclease/phosphatase (EEP) superfamily protein YafD|uniref:endonuclease/exonuclease/phosphatase family protein n=1 Tax=Phocaeicola coprocola TaxID=310298 RepID=UPI0019577E73|nr:endonuclease/exonuclease/phosphatase family protein [Phocaeicola coprocola]MBM6713049.1 endonuclease/exonuclease/phosphatase family protein [Phocaeicola coprocola]